MILKTLNFLITTAWAFTFLCTFMAGTTMIAIDAGALHMPRELAVNLGNSALRIGVVLLVIERFNKWLDV